jgi:hypothetical protein
MTEYPAGSSHKFLTSSVILFFVIAGFQIFVPMLITSFSNSMKEQWDFITY